MSEPSNDVFIPPGTSTEERTRIFARARHKRSYYKNKEKNKDKIKTQRARANKKYYEKNPEKLKKKATDWAKKNAILIKERKRLTPEKGREYAKKYIENNKDKCRDSRKKWRNTHKEAHKEINKRYKENRRQRDPLFVVKEKLRACVRASFKRIKANKETQTEKYLGCSWLEAKQHIENLWQDGMTWENHGNGPGTWNIDHIRPVHSFKENELDQMNLIQNLQPLWWKENNEKSGKW
jgi:hypothetical protein